MARRAAVDKKGVAAEKTTTRETRIVVVVVRLGLGVLRPNAASGASEMARVPFAAPLERRFE